jgi:hypothetical protein
MMEDLKHFYLRSSAYGNQKRCLLYTSPRMLGCSIMILGIMLLCLDLTAAQSLQSNQAQRKADFEVQKLELEVQKLREAQGDWPGWLTGTVGFLAGIMGTASSIWVARRTRYGALDQSVHSKRLESYSQVVKAAAPLAIYFPNKHSSTSTISPKDCCEMGQAMSQWYFEEGALLLSIEARYAYFNLARALTRASLADNLNVPTFPQDSNDISVEKLKQYRHELAHKYNLDDVENWKFGTPSSETDTLADKFRDFVFLQRLSSELRTKLSEDLRSRRRPS